MDTNIAFCEKCRKKTVYTVSEKFIVRDFHGCKCECLCKNAVCSVCGESIWIPEFHDFNLHSLYESYRRQNQIISLDQMKEMLEFYDIKKRPFSLAIGLGEITFTNYLEGDLPSRANAVLLYHVYNSPSFYKQLLEQNHNLISNIAYKKSLDAVNKLLVFSVESNSKIDRFASYLLMNGDVTPLQLQKLLYYIQALYIIFFNKFAFSDDCEAWQHGPVYKNVYEKYKGFRYETICLDTNLNVSLSEDEKQIADTVLTVFGFYSGKILEYFTHLELPWLKTREGLNPEDNSSRIISKELIKDYFLQVKSKYNIVSLADISVYAETLASNVKGALRVHP